MRLTPHSSQYSFYKKYPTLAICVLLFFSGLFMGWKNVPGFLKATFVLVSETNFLDILTQENNLDTIQLDISFKNLQKLEAKRLEAISKGTLVSSSDDFVNAEICYDEKTSRCKIRLKGDLSDHWSGDKVSLRVEMKGNHLLKGMSRFSLQDPVTRNNTAEWLFLATLRNEECMGVRYEFVNLTINGKKMGIYALEEHFSKELIEENKRREGVIVGFDDYLLWKKFPKDVATNIEWNSIFRSSETKVRNTRKVSQNKMLNDQKETAFNLLRSVQENATSPSQVFDSEKLGKFLAITRLWQAERGLLFGDINFYFNPVTCLLEPIGFDGNPMQEIKSPYCYFTWGDIKDNWVNFALKDRTIASAYVASLHQYASLPFISELMNSLSTKEKHYRNLLLKELFLKSPAAIWKNHLNLISYKPWNILQERAKSILIELSEPHLLQAYASKKENEADLEIVVRNRTTQPIEISGFSSGNSFWPSADHIFNNKNNWPSFISNDGNLILYSQGNGYQQTSADLHFRISEYKSGLPLYVHSRFLGSPKEFLTIQIPCDLNPFKLKDLPLGRDPSGSKISSLSSVIIESNDSYLIPNGEYTLHENLYIPPGKKLYVSPGTTLLFDSNVTFVSESPLFFHGTTEKPIVLSSANEDWAGMLIANSNGQSIFENVKFENVCGVGKGPNPQGIPKNGWTMTGGITLYNSNSQFKNCSFENFKSEDALNIISSTFSLNNCTFSSHFSDAFDGDFVQGSIINCFFSNISGDGVDFSGSRADIRNNSFENISDKAISVGEGSHVEVSTCKINNVSFGIVSKDLSVTKASNNTVTDAKTAAFAAFQKKSSFGPASIIVSQPKFSDCKQLFLIQDESVGRLDDQIVETSVFKTTDLY